MTPGEARAREAREWLAKAGDEESRYEFWDPISAATLLQAIHEPNHGVFRWVKKHVESRVADAIALIQKLDSEGSTPTLAVWYFYDDAAEWRLIIAGPTFDALLPKQEPVAYRKVVEAMAVTSLSSLSISDLKLVRTDSPLPRALRRLVLTGPNDIARAYFTDTSLNGIFIKEMIILRSA